MSFCLPIPSVPLDLSTAMTMIRRRMPSVYTNTLMYFANTHSHPWAISRVERRQQVLNCADRAVPHGRICQTSLETELRPDQVKCMKVSSSSLLSPDTTETSQTRKIVFSWYLPEKSGSNMVREGIRFHIRICSHGHSLPCQTSVPEPAGAKRHSHWQEEWRCKSRWMPELACQHKIGAWHGA